MLPVFMLFIIPFGGGIPAGVLLARANELPWPLSALLYLLSDIVLAFAFEPLLRLIVLIGRKVSWLARVTAVIKAAMDRNAKFYGGKGAGPFTLIMVAFGVDPMTGRAAALAAGHGFLAGWAIAITGDMIYYAVIAFTTLHLNEYIKDPATTTWIVLAAMILVALVMHRGRSKRNEQP